MSGFKNVFLSLLLLSSSINAFESSQVLPKTPAAMTNDVTKEAIAYLSNGKSQGAIMFTKVPERPGVIVIAKFTGLAPGSHVFRIHERPVTAGCESVGGSFNPKNVDHGAWNSTVRHVGDLHPLVAEGNGNAMLAYEDSFLSFEGDSNIIGRSVVVQTKVEGDTSSTATDQLCATIVSDKI